MKIIRKPLTTIDNRDFITGEYVKPEPVEQEINQKERVAKWLLKKQQEAELIGRKDGKVFVDWFGRC